MYPLRTASILMCARATSFRSHKLTCADSSFCDPDGMGALGFTVLGLEIHHTTCCRLRRQSSSVPVENFTGFFVVLYTLHPLNCVSHETAASRCTCAGERTEKVAVRAGWTTTAYIVVWFTKEESTVCVCASSRALRCLSAQTQGSNVRCPTAGSTEQFPEQEPQDTRKGSSSDCPPIGRRVEKETRRVKVYRNRCNVDGIAVLVDLSAVATHPYRWGSRKGESQTAFQEIVLCFIGNRRNLTPLNSGSTWSFERKRYVSEC